VKGRQHLVKIFHTAVSQTDYVDAALRSFFQIHTDQPPGDVLIFLPGSSHVLTACVINNAFLGQEDIESLSESIKLYANRLPQDKMGVRLGLYHIYASFLTPFVSGAYMSNVRVSSTWTTSKDILSSALRHSQMYSGH